MTMDLQPETGGRWHFTLGPVEKWAVRGVAAGIVALAFWLITSVNTLITQQALTNQQLQNIQVQLSGVPELSTRVTRLELQTEQNKVDIQELRQLKGVR